MKKSIPPGNIIIDTAIGLFQDKGYNGTEMSEIAKKSGISEKELEFLYPRKDLIFKDVFIELYSRITPQLEDILNGNMTVFDKIRHFTNEYVNFINDNRFLPLGLMRKLNYNTDFAKEFIVNLKMPSPGNFYKQVEKEIEKGNIRPMNPKQLMINIFALSVFPHVASPLMKDFINADNDEFDQIKNANRTLVADFIINSIRVDKSVYA
ncbi:MAG: TetR/AcrR family transcriptional regulator [Flavobacteriaceae bacterium]|nr:TetR/AcrR family transcriptional regulator [Flavobacteriaceae bacterium]